MLKYIWIGVRFFNVHENYKVLHYFLLQIFNQSTKLCIFELIAIAEAYFSIIQSLFALT